MKRYIIDIFEVESDNNMSYRIGSMIKKQSLYITQDEMNQIAVDAIKLNIDMTKLIKQQSIKGEKYE